MQKTAYVAEDLPTYMFDTSKERPWRDEDVAMSAPNKLAKDQGYTSALEVMIDHLTRISTMQHVIMGGEQGTYLLAAAFFGSFKTHRYPAEVGIQISGRVYRVREQ